MGTGYFFSGVKRRVRDVDHTPPFSVKVKNEWSYTCNPPYAFIVRTGKRYTLLCHLPSNHLGHAVVQLAEAPRYKVVGSIPDGVIGIFR
jgi:hypothetical protein